MLDDIIQQKGASVIKWTITMRKSMFMNLFYIHFLHLVNHPYSNLSTACLHMAVSLVESGYPRFMFEYV